jgi:hypothetical protein
VVPDEDGQTVRVVNLKSQSVSQEATESLAICPNFAEMRLLAIHFGDALSCVCVPALAIHFGDALSCVCVPACGNLIAADGSDVIVHQNRMASSLPYGKIRWRQSPIT